MVNKSNNRTHKYNVSPRYVDPVPDLFGSVNSDPDSDSISGCRGIKSREKQRLTAIFFIGNYLFKV